MCMRKLIPLAKYLLIILYISTSPPSFNLSLSLYYFLCRSLFFTTNLCQICVHFLLFPANLLHVFCFSSLFNLIKMKFRQLTGLSDCFLKVDVDDVKVREMSMKLIRITWRATGKLIRQMEISERCNWRNLTNLMLN